MNLPDLLQYSFYINKPVSDNNLLYCSECDTNIFICTFRGKVDSWIYCYCCKKTERVIYTVDNPAPFRIVKHITI